MGTVISTRDVPGTIAAKAGWQMQNLGLATSIGGTISQMQACSMVRNIGNLVPDANDEPLAANPVGRMIV